MSRIDLIKEFSDVDEKLFNRISTMYEKARTDERKKVLKEVYNDILIRENELRSMLLNTSQETEVVEWIDLNGKLNTATEMKHMIYDKLKENQNE